MKRTIVGAAAGLALAAFLAYQPVSGETRGQTFTRVQPEAPSSTAPEIFEAPMPSDSPMLTPAPENTPKKSLTIARELRSQDDEDEDDDYYEDSDQDNDSEDDDDEDDDDDDDYYEEFEQDED